MTSLSTPPEVSPRKTYRVMAFSAIAIILLLSLAIYSLSQIRSAPWTSSLGYPKIQAALLNDLPQFDHKDGDKSLTPQMFAGHWTLLSFWSYSCPPCLEEMPSLNALSLSWQGPEFQIITVNVDSEKSENFELAKNFLLEQAIELPTYFDPKGSLKEAFAINEYPRHFLVNPDSKIVWEATGAFHWEDPDTKDQLLKLMEPPEPSEVSPGPAE